MGGRERRKIEIERKYKIPISNLNPKRQLDQLDQLNQLV